MERVPWRAHLVAGEGVPWRIALGDQCAVQFLNGDPLRREHRALIRGPIRTYRRAFLVQPHRHASRARILYDSFKRKESAAADNRRLDLQHVISLDSLKRFRPS